MTSLDPLYPVGDQIAEPLIEHGGAEQARRRASAQSSCCGWCRFQQPERRVDAYPHELSGGQRQRVMIAMALANDPDILIADEPTTALDVTIQAQILALLKSLQARLGMAIIFITHDLGIVRRFADRVYVMRAGEVVEDGPVARIFASPQHDYTKMLLAAEPKGTKPPVPDDAPPLLEAGNIEVTFHIGGGFFSGGGVRAEGRRRRLAHAARGPDDRHRRRVRAPASRRSAARCCSCFRARARSASRGAI